jgi:acyl carrier protein
MHASYESRVSAIKIEPPKTRIHNFVRQELLGGDESRAIGVDDDLLASGDIDSMGIMRLIGYIESEYQTAVPPEDVTIENFGTITAVGAYVERLTEQEN